MKRWLDLRIITLAVLLLGCILAAYLTNDPRSALSGPKRDGAVSIDQSLLQTAQQVNAAADTPTEQALSHEALRLADHELDQAFASALREAATINPVASGPVRQLLERVASLKEKVAASQQHVADLSKSGANDAQELAKAQLALDQDELEDAQQDLARQGGDRHAALEQAIEEHEAAQRQTPRPATLAGPTVTLSEQIRAWFSLSDRKARIELARVQAEGKASNLKREHDAVEKQTGAETPDGNLDSLHRRSAQRKSLSEFDKRIQDCQQLADVYSRWQPEVKTRRSGILHLLLGSFAWVLTVLLITVLIIRAIRHAFSIQTDPRRLHQLRVMATIGVQLIALGVILLITFGPPNQLSTVIGLATAGLTLALKDFIVGFIGWFALMGKNGIRVGDWVEIKGVSGEVIEIGLLKTVLLETGNWTNAGHPTGRRVAFVNSYAIEGHYFNFSTSGQWLWDELQVTLPSTVNPSSAAQQIREIVERETEADASAAEKDWARITHQYGTRVFSAKPAVEFRTSVIGLDVAVRYITRAPQRYQVKAHLFEAIVDLLHNSEREASGTGVS